MIRPRSHGIAVLALAVAACSQSPEATTIEVEAQSFMTAYARDLTDHDVESITRRYDRRGAHRMLNTNYAFSSFDVVRAGYGAWQGPAAFEWGEMTFDALSEDAVIVIGSFLWTTSDSVPPASYSYTAVLLRQNGELRIRLENEVLDPAGDDASTESSDGR